MEGITLGSDVELAVHKSGVPVSVEGMLGGTKKEPVWYDNFNIQEDNVNAEYAINPVSSLDEWLLFHHQAIHTVGELLPTGHGVLFNASTYYDTSQLESDSAQKFGCDTDWSAWRGSRNRPPDPRKAGSLRTCGGHIHVGYSGINGADLVKWMDILLGIQSIFMEEDTTRRKLYGQAGSYRPKPYGIEYRALSNFWASTEEGMTWAYEQTMKAVQYCKDGVRLSAIPNLTNIPRCIDTYDVRSAEATMAWLTKEGYC